MMFIRHDYKKAAAFLLAGLLVTGGTVPAAAADTEPASEESSETESGIRVVEVTILSLIGNQMTFRIDETVGEDLEEPSASEQEEDSEEPSASEQEEDSEEPSMSESGEDSERPSMPESGEDSERPSMPESGEDGEKPSMPESGEGGGRFSKPESAENSTETVYIPVSAPVLNTAGEQVSYTILQSGDTLEITFETDSAGNEIITQIQILEVSDSSSTTDSSSGAFDRSMQGGFTQGGSAQGGMQMPDSMGGSANGGSGGGPNGGPGGS